MKSEVTLSVKYNPHASGTETWEPLPAMFCPNCGEKNTVWHRAEAGDYYVGEEHLCTACSHSFYLPAGVQDAANDKPSQMRLAAIRAAAAEQ